jgi:hypothetical protein
MWEKKEGGILKYRKYGDKIIAQIATIFCH